MRTKFTYANVVSSLALFLALGGVSYAAVTLPKNSVGSKQIKGNAVTTKKVKNGSLLHKDFKPGQLPRGATGATGATGAPGAQGARGDTGIVDTSNFYSKGQSDGRYLRSTVVVVKTITGAIDADSVALTTVNCPAGYQAVGGGVDPSGTTYYTKVSSSAPTFAGNRTSQTPDGQQGPATGWSGGITTQGTSFGAGVVKVAVVCSPIG